jgi:hypothetical protein
MAGMAEAFATMNKQDSPYTWEKDAYSSIPNFQGARRKKKQILSDMGGSFYAPEKNIIKTAGP